MIAARTGVAFVFGLNGLALASWFARVPAVRDGLGLTAGQLGLLLLAGSAGSLLALPTAGVVAHRFGAARTVAGATMLVAGGLAVVGTTVEAWASVAAVAVGLFALGYGSGVCEVAMNVEAAAVERRLGRTVMPRFHAAWSLGTVAGAALGAGMARIGLPVAVHLVLVAAVVLVGTLVAVRAFLPAGSTGTATPAGSAGLAAPAGSAGIATPAGPAGVPTRAGGAAAVDPLVAGRPARRGSGVLAAWREPRTLLIGLLVLVMAFTEGTANDWLAVAFVDGYGVGEAGGAVVFGVFVAAMTLGRTFGTIALDRWGRGPVLTFSMLLAAAGAAVAVLAGTLPVALAGVALWGLGTALGFPVGMSAAADDEEHAPARVSVVAVIGYTAFLAGPPAVGLLGDRVGTLSALLVVPLLVLPAIALVPATRRPPQSR
ncbi:MFS transporter [Solwaraspora sp. WMMD1047]|uniref:MFS transporter n=1 Tax=Solwaraspora sp. WMMD1047 TaxID=3016102 RepID=UPI0024168436|nr:MFS transporter [Solwaraspora sp. WMMD1047]MDG4831493.1 MFS transporter [Solwaraspora sp. WMMD1047]